MIISVDDKATQHYKLLIHGGDFSIYTYLAVKHLLCLFYSVSEVLRCRCIGTR